MKVAFDARRLDVRRFAQQAASLGSDEQLGDYPRLAQEAQGRGGDARVTWSARGELHNPGHVHPQVWLHLRAAVRLTLVCQRCLNPVVFPLSVERAFRFVPDEATAAAEDDQAEEDVLAESASFDLHELVEDELLMEVPLAPRHEHCPEVLPASAGEPEFEAAQEQRENPFEALRGLRHTRR